MPTRRDKSSKSPFKIRNKGLKANKTVKLGEDMPQARTDKPMSITSGLDTIHIAPRTPSTARKPYGNSSEDELELSLLGEEERRQAANGLESEEQGFATPEGKKPVSNKDKRGIALLIVLCEYLVPECAF